MSTDSDCPPDRKNYPDVPSYFKAIHKCNQEKVKNMNISENKNPDFCDNRNTMKEKDDNDKNDKLIKFIIAKDNTHCMYVSEFKMHIQNICNIYTEWICVNENLCNKEDENGNPDTSGRGYAPKMQAYDLLGILKFTNHCCIINDIYWSVPLFSKGLLSMKTILKIQEKVKQEAVKQDTNEYEIEIKPITKNKDDFRLGNIYGTFGIGQTHAQADPTTFYVIDDEDESELVPSTMKDCNLQPDNEFFAFENMEKKLSLQLEIKDLINNLYNRPLDLYSNEELKKFFLTDEKFKEEDICPDTETVVQLFFMYYNNEILIPGLDDKENKITENMTLKDMRKIVNENQELIEEQNREKNNASIDDIASSEDLMNMSIPDSPMNMNMNMNTPEHFTQGTRALFSGSPMSPINGRELDTSTRSDYDIALGNESTYINRTPISPMMQRLSMSDLVGNTPESATYDNRSVNNSDNDQFNRMIQDQDQGPMTGNLDELLANEDTTNAPTTPITRRGGRKTFNRKKKPKKNRTKKKKRTRKRSKI